MNAIIDWSDSEIWYYIKHNKLDYCKLYDEGYKRLGCIGCPQASLKERKRTFERYPNFKRLYINAFDKMLLGMNARIWKTGKDVFDWWLYGQESCKIVDGQVSFFAEDEHKIEE